MGKHTIRVLFIVFSLLFLSTRLNAAEPRITDLSVSDNSNSLVISFKVNDAFTEDIEKAIMSGIPTSFLFTIEVYRARTMWRDERIGYLRFHHTVEYDNLKDQFNIRLEEAGGKDVIVKDMGSVREIMSDVKEVVSMPLLSFSKGGRYYVRVRATLRSIKLPFPFKYVLFFVSFWDFETSWQTKGFMVDNGKVILTGK